MQQSRENPITMPKAQKLNSKDLDFSLVFLCKCSI